MALRKNNIIHQNLQIKSLVFTQILFFLFWPKYVNAQTILFSFNLPDLPSDCKQALIGTWISPDDGYALTQCSTDCYHKTNSSIISFLMDRRKNKSGDMLLNYKIGGQINYSIFQVDLIYVTEGDVKLNVDINSKLNFSFATIKYSYYFDFYRDLYCQSTQVTKKASLSFYKSDANILDNNLNIHFEKISNDQSNYYLLGIKAIQISMTCSITCEICLNDSNCDVCKSGFKKITLPSGLQVCEQITSCSQNCFLCAVSKTENICTQCFPGYSLQNNQCISLDKLNICKSQPQTYYADPNQCIKYNLIAAFYYNGQYQRTNQEIYSSYKCPENQVVLIQPQSYYSLYLCGCITNNCASCPNYYCSTCSEGYTLTNSQCVSTYSTFQVDQRNPQNCISINSCVVSNCQTFNASLALFQTAYNASMEIIKNANNAHKITLYLLTNSSACDAKSKIVQHVIHKIIKFVKFAKQVHIQIQIKLNAYLAVFKIVKNAKVQTTIFVRNNKPQQQTVTV
ncbi:hypothetical protein TTHERM_00510160 (macronuclear) [Tetrahymena thermophila SB210]|uniref:Uncharacterized protein n=1 Tax=Tetrahymena thermophila (strain SB210) TaxID=312017 RepID=I7MIU7_TETTS|nr:hypothetical protein TTHERM_00510160 [Tetrahymena thermophila SB210]EAR94976.2 hypothetical protein TTHERM_00510160 [Tetrahymena thermophila SB210]|eukprot:XP_001015221.2 hypothetical protein TTHERM_00510160 [Tetrahymena thermophila SB210]